MQFSLPGFNRYISCGQNLWLKTDCFCFPETCNGQSSNPHIHYPAMLGLQKQLLKLYWRLHGAPWIQDNRVQTFLSCTGQHSNMLTGHKQSSESNPAKHLKSNLKETTTTYPPACRLTKHLPHPPLEGEFIFKCRVNLVNVNMV